LTLPGSECTVREKAAVMEIRIWLPESWSAFWYMIRHPRSWVIGRYGFDRWTEEHQHRLAEITKRRDAEDKLQAANQKLAELGRELSAYKRGDKTAAKLQKRVEQLERELEQTHTMG
jgi:hypothetical protein